MKKTRIQFVYAFIFTTVHSKTRSPSNFEAKAKWIAEIKKYQNIDQNFKICQLHFEDKFINFGKGGRTSLIANAIPTIFKSNRISPETTADVNVDEVDSKPDIDSNRISPEPFILNRSPNIRTL